MRNLQKALPPIKIVEVREPVAGPILAERK